jgi:hypothetical protein
LPDLQEIPFFSRDDTIIVIIDRKLSFVSGFIAEGDEVEH